MFGWEEGHPARRKLIPLILRGTFAEQVEEPADPGSPGKTAVKRK